MYESLPDKVNLPELEKEVLEFWKRDNTFVKSIESKNPEKYYTFYEGPPTANGMPGIHHVISRTVKDIICRYKTMRGYMVERVAGWDTHGLPVEVEVEKTLGIHSKKEIIEFGPEKFNKACKESIFKYLNEWEVLTERMGYWIDLDNAYITFKNEYIESVWWALKQFFDSGVMYKGFKIQPFCPVCESPLSSHEVALGYKEVKDPSIYIKFAITHPEFKGVDFLVWTTTPWTLLSNVALAVNPESLYTLIELENGNKFILAKDRLIVIKENYNIIKEFYGKELEKISYEPLFKFLKSEKRSHFVTTGNFVTMEDGTGIVHIAPAYGEDDYNIGLEYDLPILMAVGKDGNVIQEVTDYAGMNFKTADPLIIDNLKQRGRLYKKETYEHQYPFCWRHKTPLIYYATDSWFIKTTEYKDKMIKLNKEINWNPPDIGEGRFGNWLEENKDWALSRNRFWGTPLPIWYYVNENGEEIYEIIGSIEELKQRAINFEEVYPDNKVDLHKPYIDDVKIRSKDGKYIMTRTPEVIDCWFDSGSMPFAQFHYPFENKEKFEKHYPADFIAEGLDQTRGWFYSLHAIGTFLFNKPAYKNLIVNGLILDKERKKMSKSLGNVVNPLEILEEYGADLLRWYLVYSSPVWKSKPFNEEDLIDIRNKLFDTVINTFKFFVIYSNLTGFDYRKETILDPQKRKPIDKWLLSRINSVKKEYLESLDLYDITKASRILFDFTIDELSNWYVRRNRKRFRNPEDETDKLSCYQTLYEVLIELMMMLAPIMPFLPEIIYSKLTKKNSSIHLEEFTPVDESIIDEKVEEEMRLAQLVVYIVRAIRVKNNLKVRQPLKQILIPVLNKKDKETLLKVKDIILEEVNIKELNIIEGNSDIITKKAKPVFKVIGPKYGKQVKEVQKIINDLNTDEVYKIETEGKIEKGGITITNEDVEIITENIEGWIVEREQNLTVAVDTRLTQELIEEGIAREFINRIQNYRKTNDFNVNEKINIYTKTTEDIKKAILNHIEKIKNEVYCENIVFTENIDTDYYETDINGKQCTFKVEKLES
ncbi:MAG: isoleucine--tRNA ligase [Ignavibacteria bacterium]|nr:isoleucine--tRNA ligase [Ignavibacteria bacterium]